MKKSPDILIYTDGSSRGNPGPGGYGIIIQNFSDKRSKEFSKGFRKTTNNRMELLAVIEAIKKIMFIIKRCFTVSVILLI